MKKEILKHIPSTETLERRFSFLEDHILRDNVVIAFRYAIFLTVLQEEQKFRGVIAYSIYKDIILYTATIVESCLHHAIQQFLSKGIVKNQSIMPIKWVDTKSKDIYNISDTTKVCGVIREGKHEEFSSQTQFLIINRAAKKSGILDNRLFLRAEALRKKRNKIHLASLGKADDYYMKKDVQSAFSAAAVILKAVEAELNKIKQLQDSENNASRSV